MIRPVLRGLLLVALLSGAEVRGQTQAAGEDVLLSAMLAELDRSKNLRLEDLDRPYFIEYAVHDTAMFYTGATLGAQADRRVQRVRLPRIRVRVGDYDFDNGNYIFSDSFVGTPYPLSVFPIDNHQLAIRRHLWLATDMVYKSALQVIARKRAALRNLAVAEPVPDFARAEPVKLLEPVAVSLPDLSDWDDRIRRLSLLLKPYPAIVASGVEIQVSSGAYYLVNSEGTQVRIPEQLYRFQARANALALDGMLLRDSTVILARRAEELPGEEQLRNAVMSVGANLQALVQAPPGEDYTGPVVFEPLAAAQLFADLFGRNLGYRRRPVSEPGRPLPFAESELESRLGARVLPEWMDVIDDPTAREWNGRPLMGSYPVDLEGVIPKPLPIVEKGVLKNLLSTRQPVKGRAESNGRARLYGSFGANAAAFGNLIVQAGQVVPFEDLKRRLAEMVKERGRPYGLLVRKLDFPSTASNAEFQRMAARMAQAGGASRIVSSPLLVYRVYPDGKEELIRGMRFRDLTVRSLRDILAAGGEPVVFHYLENGAPLALTGAAQIVAECSVVAPGLLFDELQLERVEEELPRLPVVPPPPLDASP